MYMEKRFNKNYIHHQKSHLADVLKEVVFGVEDGMVSTLGSITGIAIGSGSAHITILAGVVIIAVESISMGIGSYLSDKSEEELDSRKIEEEKEELKDFPEEEKEELRQMYIDIGWSPDLAQKMSDEAAKKEDLILREMVVHELKIPYPQESTSIKGGLYMFFSYIVGGLVPLFFYLILPVKQAMPLSIIVTMLGLFGLGVSTAKFTKQPIFKSSMRVVIMGGIALVAGLIAGIYLEQ